WVAARRERPRFALQAAARPDDPDPSRTLLRAGELAESLGLDGLFIADHPGAFPDPWMHLAALAATTDRISLGSVVNCVFHRHPAQHARQAADLDRISHGRLVFGLGIGWNEPEFAQLGLPFPSVPERQAALDEAMAMIFGLWGPEPFTYAGRFWHTTGGHVGPWIGEGRPPILIAGAGKRTLGQVARYADVANFGASPTAGGVTSYDDVAAKFALLRERCAAIGRPVDTILRTHFTSCLSLAETQAAADAKLLRIHPGGVPPELRTARIAHTPDGAIRHFRALRESGAQYFVVQLLDATDEETIRLLAEAVAPRVA
ncbi:MAG TPA: LLM class flavin-dependent oxidoreductase, partial [Thermomicrobiales bacterium]|nr:LLM class flavin-dependent oxidoreductase [Thermomicrobiales bacterium]